MIKRFTFRQKFLTGLSLMCFYYPIIIYVNLRVRSFDYLISVLPYLIFEFSLGVCLTISWFFVSELIQRLLVRLFGEKQLVDGNIWSRIGQFILTILAAFIAVYLHQIISSWIFGLFFTSPPIQKLSIEMIVYRSRVGEGFFMLIAFTLYLFTVNNRILNQNYTIQEQIQMIKLQAEQLEKEHIQAQFTALKNQVNPHFLFNSLSILSSLVRTNTSLSVEFINQLAKSYRYILDQKDNELVTLETELEFIKSYTFLLNIRFSDKFILETDIPKNIAQTYQIAPLTLQLLIENAVKHNQMSEKEPLLVKLQVENETLIISNNLKKRQERFESTGVGLQNIMNRYTLLTEKSVWVGENDKEFTVKIPLIPLK